MNDTAMKKNYTAPQTEETRLDTDIRCDIFDINLGSATPGNPDEID